MKQKSKSSKIAQKVLEKILDTQDIKEDFVSGQLVFRDVGQTAKVLDGTDRKLMMVYGILAVPEHLDFKGEHQYTVNGFGGNLKIFKDSEIDVSKITKGNTPSGVLKEPIWRI